MHTNQLYAEKPKTNVDKQVKVFVVALKLYRYPSALCRLANRATMLC